MKIVICSSINFTYEIKDISDKLQEMGHKTEIPFASQKILNGELSLEDFKKEKERSGDAGFRESAERKIRHSVIKRYYDMIKDADAVFVLNLEKKKVPNYIGGNVFLEMGFAHVLDKKIFLYNDIPDLGYKEEMEAMKPEILKGDLSKIN